MEDNNANAIDLTGDGGVLKVILVEGSGEEHPAKNCSVDVHYVGTLLDGTQFDSSRERDNFFTFNLGVGQVIKAWDVGVASMKRGEKCMLTCKSEYGYGENGSPPKIPGGATLQFEIELFDWSFEKVTLDGLITKINVVTEGTGAMKPNDGAVCEVRYTGAVYATQSVFSPEQERKVTVGDDDLLPSGFNTILKHMKKGERTLFKIRSGEHHFAKDLMPNGLTANDEIQYDVELIDFAKQKEAWAMNVTEKLDFATAAKTRGNTMFKSGRWSDASKKYELVISTLENLDGSDDESKTADELLVKSWNNLAIIQLKEEKYEDVISNCTKALKVDEANPKSLYRRSTAFMNFGQLEEAFADIKVALKNDKENRVFLSQYHIIKKKLMAERKKQKLMYQKMFQKPKSKPASVKSAEPSTAEESAETSAKEGSSPLASVAGSEPTEDVTMTDAPSPEVVEKVVKEVVDEVVEASA
uniref:peptidylprolyl isomerase n=1 Tax=Hirondellea gigas TaxID=1518452 RepID=A0A2P2I0E7_9CRUS